MSGWIKSGFLTLIPVFLSSCSLIGGLGQDKCADGACETPQILDNRPLKENWYCYGVPEDRSWDCVSQPHPEKVATVIPSTRKSQTPLISEPVVHEPEEIAPELVVAPEIDLSEVMDAAPPMDSEGGATSIIRQPGDFFTVQLIAMQEENQLLEYARRNGLKYPLYARIESQDIDWYVLLLGIYPDRLRAENARNEYEGTRTLKVRPWIRKLAPLQDAIRLARQE
ncbi:MAG: hypothetical protein O6945_09985 [Gammaproteobacteria bacterium]|nr:hypothetical protein [Gammaproteobacteria bacterium]